MYTTAILLTFLAAGLNALTVTTVTGPTPPPIKCHNSYCHNKNDGNFAHPLSQHYFLQCVSGLAYCQPCWPLNLFFVPRCNQCLYYPEDECVTTKKWHPAVTFHCPKGRCEGKKDPEHPTKPFSGNIVDNTNPYQYIGCWKGKTMGCVACPSGLKFNEEWNACLYDGVHKTEPTEH